MSRILVAMLWAVAISAMALAARSGWVARDVATWLLLTMPLLAWVTIQGRGTCRQTARDA